MKYLEQKFDTHTTLVIEQTGPSPPA